MKNKAIALLCAGALLVSSSASAAGMTVRRTNSQSSVSRSITYQSKSLQQRYYQLLNTWVPAGSQQKPGTSQGTGQQPSNTDSVRSQILSLVNQARKEAGLKPLTSTSALNSAAQTRAQELNQLYSHNRPNGSSCFTVLGEKGISYRTAGENIATGYKTAQQVFNAWMNSEGHRQNILSPKFTQIGIGYTAQQGWTQLFIG